MQVTIFAFLLLIGSFAFASPSSYDTANEADLMTNNERFARDLEYRKKFAFAFAKRSSGDEGVVEARIAGPYAHDPSMRFAFAKRRTPTESKFARFARASSFA
ncbi:unnamed protein product [Caenorhabditis bovis]|uniref:Uncharacterized protein n=1 Tax=Caenorhabditis bovis TaxID=2654633 RepID=A0A8S1EZ09_9PELO|nr:unnamed protein product [Caenorhabditis bovis]